LEEDVALIELLAGYVGAALENVSLFESLAAKAKQYENLQQFSENILESINVGLIAVDLEDRVQSVNTPLELMYPLPFRQCRGRRLEEIFSGELMAEISRSREDAGIRTLYRHRVQLEGGQEKVLNIAIAPLLSKNCEWIGRLMIFDDVTDRVTLEAQLAQAEKLSSIGLLAAGVAHEVNTPLTVISTQAQMLAKQMPREDTNFRTVEKIIRQTFRASEIVNSLLNFSRTKGAAFAPVEVNQIIQDTLLLLDHQLKSARVAVERHLEPGLPLIHGNADKLQQVFLNLFLNAKDAMPEGGQLRITSWTEDSRVRIEIRDTGVGISPDHLRHIYDPFFTTKEPGRGTGLGLAVSYGIIHEHAGRIQAESRPGLGTRFELQFPVLRKPVHA
jgi:PAS domain S-box-containing protein